MKVSPLQNRVLPTGEIVAIPERGLFTGNRGILHGKDGTLGTSRWKHPNWVCCALQFKGRYHGPMPDRGWTALFFLDEAVALAAGHRPCHYCRREDALRFRACWQDAHGPIAKASEMDRALHPARVQRNRHQVRFSANLADLPTGSFVMWNDQPALVHHDQLRPFSPAGYGQPILKRAQDVTVLTPAPTVAALKAGFQPVLHPTASQS